MNNPEILYEDQDILLCRKPSGVATQTKRLGQQDMESILKNYRARKGENPYIGIVHRLDQPVEGIMVFAKNQKAAAGLSAQVREHIVGKHYYAVSAFPPKEAEAVLEAELLADRRTNFTKVIREAEKLSPEEKRNLKHAKLSYKLLDSSDGKYLFDISLYTGRQHQIRVQMADMGCPLIGDVKYAQPQDGAGAMGIKPGELALCSYKLQFCHPVSGKKMEFEIKPQGKVFVEFFR